MQKAGAAAIRFDAGNIDNIAVHDSVHGELLWRGEVVHELDGCDTIGELELHRRSPNAGAVSRERKCPPRCSRRNLHQDDISGTILGLQMGYVHRREWNARQSAGRSWRVWS
jgi:hypothetical protein